MRTDLKTWFRPTRSERLGALVLGLIVVFGFGFPTIFPHIFPQNKNPDFAEFQDEIARFTEQSPNSSFASNNLSEFRGEAIPPVYFQFNPNTANKKDFTRLGLSGRVAQTILNYRNKGGRFYEKEDLKKIYGLRPEDYNRLEKYIVLEKKSGQKKAFTPVQVSQKIPKIENNSESKPNLPQTTPTVKKTNIPIAIDVNKATPEEWQKLKGIGPYYSKRIVTFRRALGGFCSIEQIGETYHLPDSTFQSIKPYLKLSPIFKKININRATADEMKAHPYLTFKQATGIVNYRKQHGNFSGMEDLKKVGGALKPADIERIQPYLSFE